jgi:hypothetical protein
MQKTASPPKSSTSPGTSGGIKGGIGNLNIVRDKPFQA